MPRYPGAPRCEDAPCCGCCGTNIYGVNQEEEGPYADMTDDEIKQSVYERDLDYDDDHPEDGYE